MAYCVFRFRHQPGRRAVYDPENKKLEWWLTIVTAVGVGAMLAPGLFVWAQFVTVPPGASEAEAIGQQWQWSFRLPGEDGRLGKSDTQYVSSDNPLGLNPNDPARATMSLSKARFTPAAWQVGQAIAPLDRRLHSFYVPEFRTKMDLVPGMVSYVWFIPTRTGTFEILCAELCGNGHFNMRGKVVVQEESEYQAWLRKQKTFAQLSARAKQAKATQ
jgi:Heme/copper-type cytochrome/quinol oxidases, subunit 2